MSETSQVVDMINRLEVNSAIRCYTMADVLRNLLKEGGDEAMLAFTLVMAEVADAS